MMHVLLLVFVLSGFAVGQAPPPDASLEAAPDATPAGEVGLDAEALGAYRSGERGRAHQLWRKAFAEAPGPGERARIAYNLGNTSYRLGELMEAVGWYTLSLRLAPRDADAWANLEFVRAEAELEPADRGDLSSTYRRVVGSLTPDESSWFLLLAMVGWAVSLLGEALRGGAWRRAAWVGLAVTGLAALPRVHHSLAGERPTLVLENTSARSEPDSASKALLTLEKGQLVERVDELSGWIGVDTGDGRKVWLRESSVFDLVAGR